MTVSPINNLETIILFSLDGINGIQIARAVANICDAVLAASQKSHGFPSTPILSARSYCSIFVKMTALRVFCQRTQTKQSLSSRFYAFEMGPPR